MKICKKCNINKTISDYPKTGKGYVSHSCKKCTTIYKRENREKHPHLCITCGNKCGSKNSECKKCGQITSIVTKVNKKNIIISKNCLTCGVLFFDDGINHSKKYCNKFCQDKAWSIANPDKTIRYREVRKEWNDNNKEKRKEYHEQRRIANPGYYTAKAAKRKAAKLLRTPKWLTIEQFKDIEKFYLHAQELKKNNSTKYHVDHIVPLQGKTVSGLHVPWNLQVLSESDNAKKNNSFDGTYNNDTWCR